MSQEPASNDTTHSLIKKLLLNQAAGGIVVNGTPASATAAGTAGQVKWDASYIYVCVATNSWKRVAIAAW